MELVSNRGETVNTLDLIVIAIIAFFVIYCYVRGFAFSVYSFVSFVLSFALTNSLFPYVSKALKSVGGFYDGLKTSIHGNIGVDGLVSAATKKGEIDFISSLKVPEAVKTSLLKNNNPEIYKALNAGSIEDYVVSFIANTIINVISMIIVFVAVFALLKIIGMAINIISKLPVINTVNKLFGAALGFLEGVFVVWLVLAALVCFYATSDKFPVNELLQTSSVAKLFHDTNFVFKLVSGIFT